MPWEVEISDQQNNKIADVEAASVSIRDTINQEGTAIVRIAAITPDPTSGVASVSPSMSEGYLNEWNRIKIFLIDYDSGGTKNKSFIWQGYIRDSEDRLTFSELECTDFWGYAEQKKLPNQDFSGGSDTVASIIQWALDYTNNRSDTGFTLNVTTSKTAELKVEFGNSLADVMRQLVQVGIEILVEGTTIFIGDAVGRDLTGQDGVTLYYNWKNPSSANIQIPRAIDRFGAEKVNTVFYKHDSGSAIVTNKTSEQDEIATFRDYSDVNSTEASKRATELVNNNSDSDREFEVVPKLGDFKLGDLKIGDLVNVRVDTENPLMNFNTSYRIAGIRTDRRNPEFIGRVTLSNKKLREFGFEFIQRELKRLQARL